MLRGKSFNIFFLIPLMILFLFTLKSPNVRWATFKDKNDLVQKRLEVKAPYRYSWIPIKKNELLHIIERNKYYRKRNEKRLLNEVMSFFELTSESNLKHFLLNLQSKYIVFNEIF